MFKTIFKLYILLVDSCLFTISVFVYILPVVASWKLCIFLKKKKTRILKINNAALMGNVLLSMVNTFSFKAMHLFQLSLCCDML